MSIKLPVSIFTLNGLLLADVAAELKLGPIATRQALDEASIELGASVTISDGGLIQVRANLEDVATSLAENWPSFHATLSPSSIRSKLKEALGVEVDHAQAVQAADLLCARGLLEKEKRGRWTFYRKRKLGRSNTKAGRQPSGPEASTARYPLRGKRRRKPGRG